MGSYSKADRRNHKKQKRARSKRGRAVAKGTQPRARKARRYMGGKL